MCVHTEIHSFIIFHISWTVLYQQLSYLIFKRCLIYNRMYFINAWSVQSGCPVLNPTFLAVCDFGQLLKLLRLNFLLSEKGLTIALTALGSLWGSVRHHCKVLKQYTWHLEVVRTWLLLKHVCEIFVRQHLCCSLVNAYGVPWCGWVLQFRYPSSFWWPLT